MKKLLLLTLLLPIFSFAQSGLLYGVFPTTDGKVTYTKVIEVKGATKDRLFSNIKQWAINAYKSQKATLESEDKETGYMVYKGYFPTVAISQAGLSKGKPYERKIYNTLKIYVKDEKVKMVLTDIAVLGPNDYLAASVSNAIPQPARIDGWQDELDYRIAKQTISKAKAERWQANNNAFYRELDAQLKEIMEGISAKLAENKSEFDF